MTRKGAKGQRLATGAGALALALGLSAGVVAQTAPAPTSASGRLRLLIANAVLDKVGRRADVTVGAIAPEWDGPVANVALDPAAKIGPSVTVTIFTAPGNSVRVRVELNVIADYVCVSHPIPAGTTLAAVDLTPIHGALAGVPFRRMPTATELVGARALRPLVTGEVVEPGFVAIMPLVHAGQPVTATAHVGLVEVSSSFVAVDNGSLDDVIRIVNPETKRTLRARVVSGGHVEVINVQ